MEVFGGMTSDNGSFASLVSLVLVLASCCPAAKARTDDSPPPDVRVTSPDGKTQIFLGVGGDRRQLGYRVTHDGKNIIEQSSIDIRLAGSGSLGAGVSLEQVAGKLIDKTSELAWGKSRRIRDFCHEASVKLKSKAGKRWQVEMRAYNDGVAFRYGFTAEMKPRDFIIDGEDTEFRLAGDPRVIYMTVDGFHNSHEARYERRKLSELPAEKLIDKPLLAVWPDGIAAAITEGRLRNFAGLYLEHPKDGAANLLRTRLSPLLTKPGAVVAGRAPQWSPWRVVLVGDEAGKLIESNLLLCLNEPAEGDFSWIKPGKTTWPWWNGTIEHGKASTPASNFAIHKQYIDFCAKQNCVSRREQRRWQPALVCSEWRARV